MAGARVAIPESVLDVLAEIAKELADPARSTAELESLRARLVEARAREDGATPIRGSIEAHAEALAISEAVSDSATVSDLADAHHETLLAELAEDFPWIAGLLSQLRRAIVVLGPELRGALIGAAVDRIIEEIGKLL